MFIKVQYYKAFDLYAGRLYTYKTELAVEPGDKVIAPTYNEPKQKAVVREIDVPEPEFVCREIMEFDPEGEVVCVD
jgi:hypothetical protein